MQEFAQIIKLVVVEFRLWNAFEKPYFQVVDCCFAKIHKPFHERVILNM